MEEYHPTRGIARARDFYDIHRVLSTTDIDLASADNLELIKQIFAAKKVPLMLLDIVPQYRELHRPDWPAVMDSVSSSLEEYDFYFDFVLSEIERLETLWVEESPV